MAPHSARPDLSDEDRGCVRLVLAVPIGILTLLSAYFCWTALTIEPQGVWDIPAHRGIELSCFVTVVFGVALVALWLPRSVRRVISWTWVAPGAVLGIVAAVRWTFAA
ncbi:hypothetical protein GTY65_29925 [Streptomyces sp. SID8379]|uniref:hypothetical protein n=1 Tax=unclassified Streptomyces TaxID=2593676 RepID=UPI00036B8DE0|nr:MULTISPECIES: hypothetical protein [unclassified Streptomyces]MYW68260.1 hypothetical protein [Streptomyces sp. SID8379]